jgi:2-polyprenyl-3-methyl-5-hydroxy-6-metoxy-1,4-benzoquinol methylase
MIPGSASHVLNRLLYRFAAEEVVETLQRPYARFFAEAKCRRVVDLGCGRGLFLDVLRDEGMDGIGVDSSEATLEPLRARGYNVVHNDVVSFLRASVDAGEHFDGILCSHVVEHLPGEAAIEMLRLAAQALRQGGRLVVATPNMAHPEVATLVFWLDVTHVRPYPRMLLEAILEEVGMRVVVSFDDPATMRPYFQRWREARRLPHDMARFGPRVLTGTDSVVVAERV